MVSLLVPPLAFGFLAYFMSAFLTQLSIGWAHKRQLLAHPNERSSHTMPTPRVGGIGLVGGIVIPLVLYFLFTEPIQKTQGFTDIDRVPWLRVGGILGATILAFIMGFWDDQGDPPAVAKLAGQAVIAIIPPACGLALRQVMIPFLGIVELPFVVGALAAWMLVMLMMNVVNFMDGINGLAGRMAEVCGFVFFLFALNLDWFSEIGVLGAVLVGTGMGFLKWNLGEAKTFLGDCGSQALGAFIAIAILLVDNNDLHWISPPPHHHFPVVASLIAVSLPVFDVLLTLVRRARRGESLLKAHRTHLYQRHLIATGENHERTLDFFSNHLYATAVLAVVYGRLFGQTGHSIYQLALLGGVAAVCVSYYRGVTRAEALRAMSGEARA